MFDNAVNPIFALAVLLFAFSFSSILANWLPTPASDSRISSLDGLRGVLVLSVFVAHSSVWYFFLKTGIWAMPPSNLFGNLGEASVALFFMITGFLFFSKILRANGKTIDWTKIYISRILRLVPLYIFMVLLLCVIVVFKSKFVFLDSPKGIARSLYYWLTFGFLGMPDINQVKGTARIIAFVIWTLPYEWIFYLVLPTLSLLTGAKPSKTSVCASILVISFIAWKMRLPGGIQLFVFLGGIVAAYCEKSTYIRAACAGRAASFIAIICLGWVLVGFSTTYAPLPILLLSVAFIIIACGNSMFGLLCKRGVRLVGDAGYSVYLLHGIFLYLAFNAYTGKGLGGLEHPMIFWAAVMALTVPLICFCVLTFSFVETPAMNSVAKARSMISRIGSRITRAFSVSNPAPRA